MLSEEVIHQQQHQFRDWCFGPKPLTRADSLCLKAKAPNKSLQIFSGWIIYLIDLVVDNLCLCVTSPLTKHTVSIKTQFPITHLQGRFDYIQQATPLYSGVSRFKTSLPDDYRSSTGYLMITPISSVMTNKLSLSQLPTLPFAGTDFKILWHPC